MLPIKDHFFHGFSKPIFIAMQLHDKAMLSIQTWGSPLCRGCTGHLLLFGSAGGTNCEISLCIKGGYLLKEAKCSWGGSFSCPVFLHTEIRSSCKHLSKVSDDRQGYLQSAKGFKVLNSVNPPHLILVGRDQPLERVSDHRKRDGSRGESCNVWLQRRRQ